MNNELHPAPGHSRTRCESLADRPLRGNRQRSAACGRDRCKIGGWGDPKRRIGAFWDRLLQIFVRRHGPVDRPRADGGGAVDREAAGRFQGHPHPLVAVGRESHGIVCAGEGAGEGDRDGACSIRDGVGPGLRGLTPLDSVGAVALGADIVAWVIARQVREVVLAECRSLLIAELKPPPELIKGECEKRK